MRRVSLALVICAALPSAGVAQTAVANPPLPQIRVEGLATREVAPDLAVVTVGVTTERTTAADAAAENGKAASALIARLKAAGFPDGDLATVEASLTPVYAADRTGAETSKVQAFRAVNTIAARSHDLAGLGTVLGRLLDGGANTLGGVSYQVEKPEPVLDGLRADAVRDARHKAEIAAEAAGVKLGRILEILPEGNTGGVFPRAAMMKAAAPADSGPTPLEPGLQRFEARASVTWELVP